MHLKFTKRVCPKCSYNAHNGNYARWWMCELAWLWRSFHNVYLHQNITLYFLNIYNFCQLYLSEAGKTKFPFVTIACYFKKASFLVIEFVSKAVEPRSQERPSVGLPLGLQSRGRSGTGWDGGDLPSPPLGTSCSGSQPEHHGAVWVTPPSGNFSLQGGRGGLWADGEVSAAA